MSIRREGPVQPPPRTFARVIAPRVFTLIVVAIALAWPQGFLRAWQRGATQPPASQKSSALAEAAPLSSKVLPNGLEIVVFEDHAVPLVTVELAVRNGSFTETPELNGISHLYEHMFFKTNRATLRGAAYLRYSRPRG